MRNVHNFIDSEFEGTDDKDTRWDMAGESNARRVRKRERDQAGRVKGKRGEVAESKGSEGGRGVERAAGVEAEKDEREAEKEEDE